MKRLIFSLVKCVLLKIWDEDPGQACCLWNCWRPAFCWSCAACLRFALCWRSKMKAQARLVNWWTARSVINLHYAENLRSFEDPQSFWDHTLFKVSSLFFFFWDHLMLKIWDGNPSQTCCLVCCYKFYCCKKYLMWQHAAMLCSWICKPDNSDYKTAMKMRYFIKMTHSRSHVGIMVSVLACHDYDPGSVPSGGWIILSCQCGSVFNPAFPASVVVCSTQPDKNRDQTIFRISGKERWQEGNSPPHFLATPL